jgi:hypothetical protein
VPRLQLAGGPKSTPHWKLHWFWLKQREYTRFVRLVLHVLLMCSFDTLQVLVVINPKKARSTVHIHLLPHDTVDVPNKNNSDVYEVQYVLLVWLVM